VRRLHPPVSRYTVRIRVTFRLHGFGTFLSPSKNNLKILSKPRLEDLKTGVFHAQNNGQALFAYFIANAQHTITSLFAHRDITSSTLINDSIELKPDRHC